MSSFRLIKASCVDQEVDAIVNAANSQLQEEVRFAEQYFTKQNQLNLLVIVLEIILYKLKEDQQESI